MRDKLKRNEGMVHSLTEYYLRDIADSLRLIAAQEEPFDPAPGQMKGLGIGADGLCQCEACKSPVSTGPNDYYWCGDPALHGIHGNCRGVPEVKEDSGWVMGSDGRSKWLARNASSFQPAPSPVQPVPSPMYTDKGCTCDVCRPHVTCNCWACDPPMSWSNVPGSWVRDETGKYHWKPSESEE